MPADRAAPPSREPCREHDENDPEARKGRCLAHRVRRFERGCLGLFIGLRDAALGFLTGKSRAVRNDLDQKLLIRLRDGPLRQPVDDNAGNLIPLRRSNFAAPTRTCGTP